MIILIFADYTCFYDWVVDILEFSVNSNKKQCYKQLKESLDNPFSILVSFGCEKYTGWVRGPLFSISYSSGQEFGRRNYPIFNKAIGFMTEKNDTSTVHYFIFKGLTDPVSVIIQYFFAFLIFFLIRWSIVTCLICAAVWAALVAGTTLVATLLSESGDEGEERLNHFIISR
jgi:hypothetical protein